MSRKPVLCRAQKDHNGNLSSLEEVKPKMKGGNFYMQDRPIAAQLALDTDLGKMEYKVLLYLLSCLEYNNDLLVTQKGLAEALCVHESAMSKAINLMVKKGILSRKTVNGLKVLHMEEPYATRKRNPN